jgi:tritrans,polycis-undecaprenyl-diphosphate synthase [geranylgeranyl-diphosphate specific]
MNKKGLHIGIILDGNRRFAKKKNIPIWKGHEYGAKKVEELIKWGRELNIREITLYAFSIENFNRPENEKKEIFKLFKKNFKKILKGEDRTDRKIRINFIGRLDMFPKEIVDEMEEIIEKTRMNKGFKINFAMGYGGRAEIVDAVKKISAKVKKGELRIDDIDEGMVTANLYLSDEPDLIIRPGGEKRASNFLIWQGNYSEWHFSDKMWPEFTEKDLLDAINDFESRERRFGK